MNRSDIVRNEWNCIHTRWAHRNICADRTSNKMQAAELTQTESPIMNFFGQYSQSDSIKSNALKCFHQSNGFMLSCLWSGCINLSNIICPRYMDIFSPEMDDRTEKFVNKGSLMALEYYISPFSHSDFVLIATLTNCWPNARPPIAIRDLVYSICDYYSNRTIDVVCPMMWSFLLFTANGLTSAKHNERT